MTVNGTWWRTQGVSVLATALCVSVALLAWFGFRAVREWRQSAALLSERRLDSAVDLFAVALSRDMRGVQQSVLLSRDATAATLDRSDELIYLLASAFARYPYLESFFNWRAAPASTSLVFFNRYDRSPNWVSTTAESPPFPVVISREPVIAEQLAHRISEDTKSGAEWSAFEIQLGGQPYQVIVNMLYEDAFREHLAGGLGFTVNLSWVRSFYFPAFAEQLARVGGIDGGLEFSLGDETGASITNVRPMSNGTATSRRTFPLLFADPLLVGLVRPRDLPIRQWRVQVHDAHAPPPPGPYERVVTLTLVAAGFCAAVLTLGLTMMSHAARASAQVAELRSDFVASMTHELKTPLATIRAISQSIASGRISDSHTVREYGQLAIQESQRLTRLVDNSLAYARVTDAADGYHLEALDIKLVLDESLRGFATQLTERDFHVDLDMPGSFSLVYGDRIALGLLFDNIIDNAVRYSDNVKWLSISAHEIDCKITIRISDKGIGIAADELGHVTRKFFRGRNAGAGGSGLGLAIVWRIVEAHRGHLTIKSAADVGTTVIVALPTIEAAP